MGEEERNIDILQQCQQWHEKGQYQKIMEAAVEQYGFCPDIVDQEQEDPTVGNLADVLWQSTVWYFWWD